VLIGRLLVGIWNIAGQQLRKF